MTDPSGTDAPRRRVYVAAVGAVTPLGPTWSSSQDRLARGDSAVARVEHFDVANFPCQVAASILDEWGDSRAGARTEDGLDVGDDRRLALARRAARQAWRTDFARDVPAERIGVFIGAESGRASLQTIIALAHAAGGGTKFDHRAFGQSARALAARIDASVVSPAAVASALAGDIGARGPATTISIACASSGAAIVEATRAIRQGRCDVALAGGVGADVDPLMLVGFGKLGALSERGVSRPFDARRDGFVVGEGAAMLVLTHRGPGLGVEITGIGRSLDAHHLTAPDPEGDGAVRAMRAALADAKRTHVGYIQAHGTSTPLNDRVEANAIRAVFGARTDEIYVSSVKGALGHWVAGAGAIGCLCAIAAVRGTILPTAGLEQPDRDCQLRHVMGQAVPASPAVSASPAVPASIDMTPDALRDPAVDAALINSFAFGGANATLVVQRTDVAPSNEDRS